MDDYNTLSDFRNGLYRCFGNGKDALMNLCDALLCAPSVSSFPELSLSAPFARRWPSLYEVFDDAQIDRKALQKLFVSSIPPRLPGKRLVLAGDATSIVRAESSTARDRTYVHVPNLPRGAKPVAPGWQFATVVALPEQPSSWTTILANRRIPSDQTASHVIALQLTELAPQLPEDTVVTLDGGFGNATFIGLAHEIPIGKLVRTAKNRTFYRPKPPSTNKRGRPRKDGDPFSLHKPDTHGPTDEHWSGTDAMGQAVELACWHNLHFKECRETSLTLIRVTRPDAHDTKREPRVIWLIWQGAEMPPLKEIPDLYRLRYCIEHSYRFDKQELLWTEPRLRKPEKFQHWTDIVDAAHNQISLARAFQEELRQPWANPKTEATPQQVRRGLARIIALLGTPARHPQPRGKAPGRSKGAVVKKAERFITILKATAKTVSAAV